MRAKILRIFVLANVLIFAGVYQSAAQSKSNEKLGKFYETYIFETIAKNKSKINLKNSRSENLRRVAGKAEERIRFLTLKKDILVDEMIAYDIGPKPYKMEYYLNKRFYEYSNCKRLADSGYLSSIGTELQVECN